MNWIESVNCPRCGGKGIKKSTKDRDDSYPKWRRREWLYCDRDGCGEVWSYDQEFSRLRYLKKGIKRQTIEIIYQETARAFTMDYLRKAVRDLLEKRNYDPTNI